jgi:hypothetical protein
MFDVENFELAEYALTIFSFKPRWGQIVAGLRA